MQKHDVTEFRWEIELMTKHRMQMEAHEAEHGPLGQLAVEPDDQQLQMDFEDRRAKGELFTQKMEK